MSPKVIISKGERVLEIDLDERTAELAAKVLEYEIQKNLTDPITGKPYPDENTTKEQLSELIEGLIETARN